MAKSSEDADSVRTRFFWDDASIKNLLLIARQYQLSDVPIVDKQKFFFNVLEQGMQQLGFPLNKAQIQRKWKSMRERYYYIKGHPEEFPAKSKWEYMNLMEQLLSGYPQIDGHDFEYTKLPPPEKLQKISEDMECAITAAVQNTVSDTVSPVNGGSVENHDQVGGVTKERIDGQGSQNPATVNLAERVNDPNNDLGELLERITAGENAKTTEVILDTTDLGDEAPSPSISVEDDTNDGTDEPPRKMGKAEVIVNGTRMEFFGQSNPDPLRPRRQRKGETNTDRIIAAMEAEGEKDRKILLQFMNEFSTSAAALTEAIKQITSHSEDQGETAEE